MATETQTASVSVPVEPRPLESLSPKMYDEWRLTGNIPDETPAPKEPEAPKAEATETERTAAPEPASTGKEASTQEPPSLHRLGYRELRNRVRELEAENERLKVAPRETEIEPEALAPRVEAKTEEKVREKPTPKDLDDKGQSKYKTYEDYLEALADYKADLKFEAYEKQQTEKAAKEATERQQRAVSEKWTGQVETARKKHADFDSVALNKDLNIPQGSAVEQWILDSEIGTEILYHLAKNPDELTSVHRMRPVQAARYLAALEAELEAPAAPKVPVQEVRTTRTPPPTREVGGRGTAAADEVQRALANDDTGAYIDAMNRREIAKAKR